MTFRIRGLEPGPFRHLFGLSDDELQALGAKRYIADSKPGFPDRIEMRDAEPGEPLLLVNYTHQPADTPYRSSHAVFIREGADVPYSRIDQVPDVMRIRPLSVRAFDGSGMMCATDLVDGEVAADLFETMLKRPDVAYLHVHYAKRGCYSGLVERA